MGKIFYWWSLSSDYTLGPLVTLLSLQEKIVIAMNFMAACDQSHQAARKKDVTLCPCLPGSPDSPLTPL